MLDTIERAKGYHFRLTSQAYQNTSRRAWLLGAVFLLFATLGSLLACLLWPTYNHTFTFYLKWQDVLVASSWCLALVSLCGCILVLRFLRALSVGYQNVMLSLDGSTLLGGRDLSPKNLISIFWAVATTFACFVVAVIGLAPGVLIGWTTQLANPALAVFLTLGAVLLSLAGLLVALPFGAFFVIGLVGGVSFCQRMGAYQVYTLSNQSTLRINSCVLAVLHPDKPESLFDLHLLSPGDQQKLLTLLHERWLRAAGEWNPTLGDEIEAALRHAK